MDGITNTAHQRNRKVTTEMSLLAKNNRVNGIHF